MLLKRMAAFLAAFVLVVLPAAAETAATIRQGLVVATGGGEHTFQVELADDQQERSRGLMYRRQMPKGEGMLFDFGTEQPVGFWMANTYIPLDMLFIKADGTVESIAERTTPMSQRSIPSKGPVRYVLEINGGLSRELGIKPGDRVSGPAMQPES